MKHLKKTSIAESLLNEYEISIELLKDTIGKVRNEQLNEVIFTESDDKEFESIQSILSHVVFWGYYYIRMIEIDKGLSDSKWNKRVSFETIPEYVKEIDNMYKVSYDFLIKLTDKEMLEGNPKFCDIEGLIEHAIVHVYRHKSQIERFVDLISDDNY